MRDRPRHGDRPDGDDRQRQVEPPDEDDRQREPETRRDRSVEPLENLAKVLRLARPDFDEAAFRQRWRSRDSAARGGDAPSQEPDRSVEPKSPWARLAGRDGRLSAEIAGVRGEVEKQHTDELAKARGERRQGDRPESGDQLPNADRAAIDPRKFVDYSMNPDNPNNDGKWKAWPMDGYGVGNEPDRRRASEDVQRQLRAGLADSEITKHRQSPHGEQFTTRTPIVGPNGRGGHVYAAWQFDPGVTDPRMVTNWLAVHRKDEQ
jgi:hypothetical protein